MRSTLCRTLFALGLLLALLLIVPLLMPIPPLEETVPPEQLAGPDSRFLQINGLTVHYKILGSGNPGIILLHSFAASTFSWREVIKPMSNWGTVVAFDRPGFGLTERPTRWTGPNPYSPEAQADLTIQLMDALGIKRAVLIGHSAGGAIALLTILKYPERVEALVLIAPAVYIDNSVPDWARLLLDTPQIRRLGPLLVRSIRNWGLTLARSAWHDPTKLTPEIEEGYTRPLRAENWDRGLWEVVRASRPLRLERRLAEIQKPVLVVTGDSDRIVPPEHSIRLSKEIPGGRLVVIPQCGHVPQEECSEPFLKAVEAFLRDL
ncbi:MAG: alpha/beta hydrolase [Thermoflexus sp.]|nr:alpha/beta hydrolase [Thermoflexus sp.]